MLDGFAVFDFETTGLKSRGSDRVAEVGVVLLDKEGNFESEFTTLLNPGRDLGPVHIHHIRGSDVTGAPKFADIAGYLSNMFRNRLLVAHNAQFDVGFLEAELNRALPEFPEFNFDYLCTMNLARDFLSGSGRSLDACCASYDIEIEAPHHALADARATAKLLRAYMDQLDNPDAWANLLQRDTSWPEVNEKPFIPKPRPMTNESETGLLTKVTRMVNMASSPVEDEFLAVLDRVIADGVVSVQESQELLDAVTRAEISTERLNELRQIYFSRLVDLVWEDSELTGLESDVLDRVAAYLDIDDDLLSQAKAGPLNANNENSKTVSSFEIQTGSLVVLTGDMELPRSHYESIITSAGFIISSGVTKKVALVVAADDTSISGKARKARDYGIPIISIHDFLDYLDR
jgi:DNA polymerase-3 subunit epsilon